MLLVHLRPTASATATGTTSATSATLAEQVWALLEQSLSHRLVLVMDEVRELDPQLVDQLVSLQHRIHAHDGIMRLCGLSRANLEALKACELDSHFACYHDRDEAVMGHPRPNQPR